MGKPIVNYYLTKLQELGWAEGERRYPTDESTLAEEPGDGLDVGELVGEETFQKLRERAMGHACWMLRQMASQEMEAGKFERWLGCVQGIMWALGTCTIDDLRDDTRSLHEQ